MKVTKYALVGDGTVNLPIIDVLPSDKFILKNIDGLGPPEFLVNIGKTIYQSGIYQGNQPQQRQLVIRVGLNPDYSVGETVEGLRETLYGMIIPPVDYLTFQIWNGAILTAIAKGWVSKFEVVPFSKDPEVQITIDCQDAYFTAPELVEVDLVGMSKSVLTIDNIGSVPTGFLIDIVLTANLSVFSITRSNPLDQIAVSSDFLIGDEITINTNDGSRGVWRNRSDVVISLIDNMDTNPDKTWPKLRRGINSFAMSSTSFNYNSVTYTPHYLGV
jgi:hypothetical protein